MNLHPDIAPKTRQAHARDIAVMVRRYPEGITTAGLCDEYGHLFLDAHPGTVRHDLVDFVQKALKLLFQKGYATFDERNGNKPRKYYPTPKLLAQYPKPEPTAPMPEPIAFINEPAQQKAELEPVAAEHMHGKATSADIEAATDELVRQAMGQVKDPDIRPKPGTRSIDADLERLYDTITQSLAVLFAYANQQKSPPPIPNIEKVDRDLGFLERAILPLRPDLAVSIVKARLYLEASHGLNANPELPLWASQTAGETDRRKDGISSTLNQETPMSDTTEAVDKANTQEADPPEPEDSVTETEEAAA